MTRSGIWALPLLLAAALRFWSLGFGLSVDRVRPDEEFVVGTAERILETSDPNPHFFHYPSFLMYLDAALIRLAGPALEPRLLGRAVSAACGVGTVLLLGFIGSRLFSTRVGFLAALFLAVAYQHVRESHFATTEIPFLFLVTASLAAAVEGRLRRHLSFFRLAALLAGLAASTKYPGVLALVPVLFLGIGCPGVSAREKWREAILGAGLFFAAFALTSPFVLLDPAGARQSVTELFEETWGNRTLSEKDPLHPLTFSLLHGLGFPLLSLGVLGATASLLSRDAGSRWKSHLVALWFATFYAVAAVTPTRFARYSLPTVPSLCLAAAAFVDSLPTRRLVKVGLALAALAPPLYDSIAFDRVLGREDTRSLASGWIRDNLPEGAAIMVSEGYGAPRIPPGHPVRSVGSRLGAVREGERDGYTYLVTHEHPALYRYSRIDGSLRKRLESAELAASFSPFREGDLPRYDELDAFYVPYERPGSVERPGPLVSIWRLRRTP
jgi:4-amino-4-deoxy-L-arabinose transferase-like glycosyltransferase